jgi:hypothetical protein
MDRLRVEWGHRNAIGDVRVVTVDREGPQRAETNGLRCADAVRVCVRVRGFAVFCWRVRWKCYS